MNTLIWIYSLISVFIVSVISFVGIISFFLKAKKLKKIVLYFVAFSAGALLGGVFIHLIPEVVKETGYTLSLSYNILGGIVLFFVIEKIIKWRHCHVLNRIQGFAIMNLIGDAVHNFTDGLIIGAAYLLNVHTGIVTTLAVILHEIPQEIGDFGVLIHGGFSRTKALIVNFASALTAFLGVISALILSEFVKNISLFLVPISAGGFIYIAGSDLIPELHKKFTLKKSLLELIIFIFGILVMTSLLFFEF